METLKNVGLTTQNLISLLISLVSTGFVSIRNYTASSGEVAHHLVNVGFKYHKAQLEDYNKLVDTNGDQLAEIQQVANAKPNNKNAFISLVDIQARIDKRKEKLYNNLFGEKTEKSKQVADLYVHVSNGIKIHKETKQVYIYAMKVNKTVITEGVYKNTLPTKLVATDNAINKVLNLRTVKYRQFVCSADQMESVKANKVETVFGS